MEKQNNEKVLEQIKNTKKIRIIFNLERKRDYIEIFGTNDSLYERIIDIIIEYNVVTNQDDTLKIQNDTLKN